MDDDTMKIIGNHLEKLADEKEKFVDLIDGLDFEGGPEDWQQKEMLANRLHNFYMGLEHIFERIAKTFDPAGIPEGSRWHQKLLQQMEQSHEHRPEVLTEETRKNLLGFLKFRHFLRRGYAVDIEWKSMQHLVENYPSVHQTAMDEIRSFLKTVQQTTDN